MLDPVQAELIPAHVTLCREDELDGVSAAEFTRRLGLGRPVDLSFGAPQLFHGHGVLLPAVGDLSAFDSLRRIALGRESVRQHSPHITLAHPRNPQAPGNTAANVLLAPTGLRVTFTEVVLIEQTNTAPWQVLEHFTLSIG